MEHIIQVNSRRDLPACDLPGADCEGREEEAPLSRTKPAKLRAVAHMASITLPPGHTTPTGEPVPYDRGPPQVQAPPPFMPA